MAALYLIATPIGNLEDITKRALRILSEVEYILAEDTRVTSRLLSVYGIKKPLLAWHEHSTEADFQRIKMLLAQGKSCAYVTDAGTPGLSDPGGKLVANVLTALPAVRVIPIPGPAAMTSAISIAGIPMHEFLFLGFLPHKKGRNKKLKMIGQSKVPVILYESVHRIKKTLGELASIGKDVILCRELTKKFETVYRGTAADVLSRLKQEELKGEFVIIVHTHGHA